MWHYKEGPSRGKKRADVEVKMPEECNSSQVRVLNNLQSNKPALTHEQIQVRMLCLACRKLWMAVSWMNNGLIKENKQSHTITLSYSSCCYSQAILIAISVWIVFISNRKISIETFYCTCHQLYLGSAGTLSCAFFGEGAFPERIITSASKQNGCYFSHLPLAYCFYCLFAQNSLVFRYIINTRCIVILEWDIKFFSLVLN